MRIVIAAFLLASACNLSDPLDGNNGVVNNGNTNNTTGTTGTNNLTPKVAVGILLEDDVQLIGAPDAFEMIAIDGSDVWTIETIGGVVTTRQFEISNDEIDEGPVTVVHDDGGSPATHAALTYSSGLVPFATAVSNCEVFVGEADETLSSRINGGGCESGDVTSGLTGVGGYNAFTEEIDVAATTFWHLAGNVPKNIIFPIPNNDPRTYFHNQLNDDDGRVTGTRGELATVRSTNGIFWGVNAAIDGTDATSRRLDIAEFGFALAYLSREDYVLAEIQNNGSIKLTFLAYPNDEFVVGDEIDVIATTNDATNIQLVTFESGFAAVWLEEDEWRYQAYTVDGTLEATFLSDGGVSASVQDVEQVRAGTVEVDPGFAIVIAAQSGDKVSLRGFYIPE